MKQRLKYQDRVTYWASKQALSPIGPLLLVLSCTACGGGRSGVWQQDVDDSATIASSGGANPLGIGGTQPRTSGGMTATITTTYFAYGGTVVGNGGSSNYGGQATGGRLGIGGAVSSGGSQSNGGFAISGGHATSGGTVSQGSTVGTGGTTGIGGRATGGMSAAAGAVAHMAGDAGLVGSAGAAGNPAVTIGGSLATGGTTATAGASGSTSNDWYVDAQNGSDEWPGTLTQPFKSLTRASLVAASYDTLYLLDGTWDYTIDRKLIGSASEVCGAESGIAFAPNVRLRAKNPGAVRIVADGNHTLCLSGGLVEGIRFDCVPLNPVVETREGSLEIVGSSLRKCTSPGFDIAGTAQVTMRPGALSDYLEAGDGSFIIVREQSSLTVQGGRMGFTNRAIQLADNATLAVHGVTFGPPAAQSQATVAIFWEGGSPNVVVDGGTVFERTFFAIDGTSPSFELHVDDMIVQNGAIAIDLYQNTAAGSANISINRLHMSNCGVYGISLSNEGATTMAVTNSQFINLGAPAMMFSSPSTVTLDAVTIAGGWGGILFQSSDSSRGSDVKIRNLSVTDGDYEGVRILGNALDSFDLGTVTSLGNNVIRGNNRGNYVDSANLTFAVPANVTIQAVGNTWDANVQGADASGHYTVAETTSRATLDVTTGSGKNYLSTRDNAGRLRLAENP